jgi:hypothetical protein
MSGLPPENGSQRLITACRMSADCVAKLFAALRRSNYRIRLSTVLNRCCAPVLVLESILLSLVAKIVLQHNLPKAAQSTAANTTG